MKKITMLVWNSLMHDARVRREIETLQEAGFKVVVIAIDDPGKTKSFEALPCGAHVLRVSQHVPLWIKKLLSNKLSALLGRVLGIFRMAAEAIRVKTDIYHSHDVNTLPMGWLAARMNAAKLVYDAHEISTDREGYKRIRWIVRAIEQFITPHVDQMFTTTKMRADYFSATYKIKTPIVFQNRPNEIAVERTEYLREIFSIPFEKPLLLYQGGLQSGRGLENIILIAHELPNIYFVFIGDGKLSDHLKRLARDLENVFFHPMMPLDQLPKATASADIGLQLLENTCLNHYSTDSNKLFEYAMAGIPVIASDFPEIRKVVKENKIGLLVDPSNLQEIISCIQKLTTFSYLREQFSSNALRAKQKLSWYSQERFLLKAYSKLLPE